MIERQKSVCFVKKLGRKLLQQQNKQLANEYSTTLCPMVPKHVSDFFIDQLNKLKQRKAEQVIRHENMESRL